ncbi:MAG: hypothetical protein ACJ8CH_19455 [Microvirga sp.]
MGFVNPSRFTTRPEIDGTFGVVASTHWIATAVGMGMLERGGNAFDAAVAIQCVDATTPKVPSISGRVVKRLGLTKPMMTASAGVVGCMPAR